MFRVSGWLSSSLLSGFFGCEMGLRASLLWGLSRLGFTLGFLWACLVRGSLSLRVSLRWKVFSHLALRFTSIGFLWLVGETGFTSLGFLVGLLELSLVFTCLYLVFAFNFRLFGVRLAGSGFFEFGLRLHFFSFYIGLLHYSLDFFRTLGFLWLWLTGFKWI